MSWLRAVVALSVLPWLAGCGVKLTERTVHDDTQRVGLPDENLSPDVAAMRLVQYRDGPFAGHAWRAPRRIAPERGSPSASWEPQALPAATLMRVRVTTYPKIACNDDPPRAQRVKARDAEMGPPMMQAEIASLGEPVAVEDVWMLARGDGGPVQYFPTTEWLGNFLRLAGKGGAIYFPPYQDCAAMSENAAHTVPRRVFDPGRLSLGARSPFIAQVVDACSASLYKRDVVKRSYHIPRIIPYGVSIGFRQERTLTTVSVSAKCVGGDALFSKGPMRPPATSSDSELYRADPPETLRATIP